MYTEKRTKEAIFIILVFQLLCFLNGFLLICIKEFHLCDTSIIKYICPVIMTALYIKITFYSKYKCLPRYVTVLFAIMFVLAIALISYIFP